MEDAQHSLSSCWDVKHAKVALTRWFSWVKAAREQVPLWWPRLCCLVVAGLEMDYFRSCKDLQTFTNEKATV